MSAIKPQDLKGLHSDSDSSSIIDESLLNFGRWLTDEDEYSDTIISSRIRLARNIQGFAFPNKATSRELTDVVENVRHACLKSLALKKAKLVNIVKLSEWDRKYFVERRLASPQFVENKIPSLLVVGPQENLSIMVNEEDHLRLQCVEPGLDIKPAWRKISHVEDELEENLNFSYSSRFGYLTACPTNLGTGMRVSIVIHLPCLSLQEKIDAVIRDLPTSEIAVRGFYGEGTESIGNIFQISNQLTLGRTEHSVIERMLDIAKKITNLEREARTNLVKKDIIKIEDSIFRALGTLQHARIISSLEAMSLLSMVRLGIELNLIQQMNRLAVSQLMVLVQPAHLQKIYKKTLNSRERDVLRAEFIRQNFKL